MPTPDLHVVAIMTAKPDQAEALRALLLPATRAFREEDGCKAYALHEDEKQPGRFISYEVWRDHDALTAHMVSPTMKAVKPKLAAVLARDMEQYLLSTLLQL